MQRSSWKGNYTNPCLTMHQPWASLLVHGIKRIEGRSWPSPIRGRLWIHAACKVPDEETIKAMESFYREIYAIDGVTDLKFPEHYPVSRLLGCVEIVGCLKREELASWEMVPKGVRLEALTEFCWLCEQPQKLLIPFDMRGNQGVYNLERKVYDSAIRGLTSVKSPLAVKFPIPDLRDQFSLKPSSIGVHFPKSKRSEVQKSSNLDVAIAGARAAATQFSKKDQNHCQSQSQSQISRIGQTDTASSARATQITSESIRDDDKAPIKFGSGFSLSELKLECKEKYSQSVDAGQNNSQPPCADSRPHSQAPSKIFAAALRD